MAEAFGLPVTGSSPLDMGEGNMPKRNIGIVSQVSLVDKVQIGEYIGTLSHARTESIFAGMRLQQNLAARKGSGIDHKDD